MSSFDSNNSWDSDNDDIGELAWNEFDWEQYLREQDNSVFRYLGFYEMFAKDPERLNKAAQCMGWLDSDDADEKAGEDDDESDDDAPYTIQKNCVFVATTALCLNLARSWERIAGDARRVPQALALAFQSSLHQGESNAMLAIHALDYGDYTLAVSLFKRALGSLNRSLTLLDEKAAKFSAALAHYREQAAPQLFDLREIWLDMIEDCRTAGAVATDQDEDDDE